MELSIYQLAVPLFSLALITGAWTRMRRGGSISAFVSWTIVWGAIATLAIFPDISNYLAQITGIKSNINAIVFFSLLVIFYLIFKIIIRQEKIEQDITKLARTKTLNKKSK